MIKLRIPAGFAGTALLCGLAAGWLTGCFDKPTDGNEPAFNTELYNLRLTEINYNPDGQNDTPGDSIEFLELKNVGNTQLSLGSLEITDGVSYVFPENAVLDAGKFYVIASNVTGFKSAYGFEPDGVYSGILKNSGEVITVKDVEFNEVIFTQFYADTGAWPGEADGEGYSLVSSTSDPEKDSTGAAFWMRSARRGGSPGADETAVTVDSSLFGLRITEIHYNPKTLVDDESDSLEFIELKNIGTAVIDLSNVLFKSGVDYTFPAGATIEAGAFVVLAANEAKFKARYPSVTPSGVYSGQLSNGGEKISIFSITSDTELAVVDYRDGGEWPNAADGDGYSLVPVKCDPDPLQNDPLAWRQSLKIDGSPGANDPEVAIITEVLTHTDPPLADAIELHNPGSEEADISGWYISDSKANPIKFKIPDNTKIPAGGYIVFDEADFNADTTSAGAFTFNSHGEEAWLIADERGCDFGYCDGCKFGELENGKSVGRYVNSQGEVMYVAQKNLTLGTANDGPLVDTLVISEIMYHSLDNASDYVEVTNISGMEISLSHPEIPDHTWKIAGIGFSFPAGVTLKPDESAVIASDSIPVETFRARYSIGEEVQVFQMTGGLQNGSEKIELLKPEDPYFKDSTMSTDSIYPYMVYDAVDYSDGKPWPSGTDGGGMSLHRKTLEVFGDDPESWVAANPTPGESSYGAIEVTGD